MTTLVFDADLEALATKISFSVGETDVYITNGSLTKMTRNFASGAVEGAVVGTPVIGAGFTTFTGNANYLSTQIDDTALMTAFAIFKRPVGWSGDAMVLSNNGLVNGDNTAGTNFWLTAAGTVSFGAARDNGSGAATAASAAITLPSNTNWNLCIGEAGTVNKITSMTNNLTASSVTATARFVKTGKLRIGASYSASHAGQVDIMITVVIPRVLTTPERDSVVAQLRAYALKYGMTV